MSEKLPLLSPNGKPISENNIIPPRNNGGIILTAPTPPNPTNNNNNESPHTTPTIDTGSDRHRRSSVIAIAAAEAIRQDRKDKRLLTQQFSHQESDSISMPPLFRFPSLTSIGSLEADEAAQERLAADALREEKTKQKKNITDEGQSNLGIIHSILSQIPAVIIASGLNFMVVSR